MRLLRDNGCYGWSEGPLTWQLASWVQNLSLQNEGGSPVGGGSFSDANPATRVIRDLVYTGDGTTHSWLREAKMTALGFDPAGCETNGSSNGKCETFQDDFGDTHYLFD